MAYVADSLAVPKRSPPRRSIPECLGDEGVVVPEPAGVNERLHLRDESGWESASNRVSWAAMSGVGTE